MRYSIEQILQAVKDELIESNEIAGKKKKLYNGDYFVIGVVSSALKRLKNGQYSEIQSACPNIDNNNYQCKNMCLTRCIEGYEFMPMPNIDLQINCQHTFVQTDSKFKKCSSCGLLQPVFM